jgi:hypothetical protein
VYKRFCFGDAAFSGRLNPKQFEIAFQVLATSSPPLSLPLSRQIFLQELLTPGRSVAEVFKEIDDDGSGFISFQEICCYLLQHQPPVMCAIIFSPHRLPFNLPPPPPRTPAPAATPTSPTFD